MKHSLLTIACICLATMAGYAQKQTSPDGKVELDFRLDAKGRPVYSLKMDGKTIIADSYLGLFIPNCSKLIFSAQDSTII